MITSHHPHTKIIPLVAFLLFFLTSCKDSASPEAWEFRLNDAGSPTAVKGLLTSNHLYCQTPSQLLAIDRQLGRADSISIGDSTLLLNMIQVDDLIILFTTTDIAAYKTSDHSLKWVLEGLSILPNCSPVFKQNALHVFTYDGEVHIDPASGKITSSNGWSQLGFSEGKEFMLTIRFAQSDGMGGWLIAQSMETATRIYIKDATRDSSIIYDLDMVLNDFQFLPMYHYALARSVDGFQVFSSLRKEAKHIPVAGNHSVAYGDHVWITNEAHTLVAYSYLDTSQAWKIKMDGGPPYSPIIIHDNCYVIDNEKVLAINLKDGKENRRMRPRKPPFCVIAADDESVCLQRIDGLVSCYAW